MDTQTLGGIRTKIDKLDRQIHELLMARAVCVEDIIAAKKSEVISQGQDPTIFRPNREAEIIQSILSHHKGALPHSIVIGMWRRLLSAFCAMQCNFSVSFLSHTEPEPLQRMVDYYFGHLVPSQRIKSEMALIKQIATNKITIGVLPLNSPDELSQWWLKLPENIYVSGHFPYVKNDPVICIKNNYMMISLTKPIATQNDKSIFKITSDPNVGRLTVIKCFEQMGHSALSLAIYDAKDFSQRDHLIEIDTFMQIDQIVPFGQKLLNLSSGKISKARYLGSYPATIDLHDYLECK